MRFQGFGEGNDLPLWQRDGLSFLDASFTIIPDSCFTGLNPKFCIQGEEEGVCADPFQACDPLRGNEFCINNPDWIAEPVMEEPVEETPEEEETPAQ